MDKLLKLHKAAAATALMALLLAACAAPKTINEAPTTGEDSIAVEPQFEDTNTDGFSGPSAEGSDFADEEMTEEELAPGDLAGAPAIEEDFAEADRAVEESAPAGTAPIESEASGFGGGGEGPVAAAPDVAYQPSLTAGAVDDNLDFDEYLQYRRDYERFVGLYNVRDVDISERHTIRVTTTNGRPVLGAEVLIYAEQNLVTSLRTPGTGVVYFFPSAFPAYANASRFDVTISKGQASQNLRLDPAARNIWEVALNTPAAQAPVNLDVLFLLDATGSMGDEIDQLKNNVLSISAQIEALPGQPDTRFGLVAYRDRGDEYVTRNYDFAQDIDIFQSALLNVQAAGGGDEPESLNEGLHVAINQTDWRVEDTVSMIILVADAEPHLNYPQDYDYSQEMRTAAAQGIKIHSIASSGLTANGEYVFRQLAQYTGGHFIFLTYESQPQSSGDPGRDDVSVAEGSYSVEDLDSLVVRLVQEELAALVGSQQ